MNSSVAFNRPDPMRICKNCIGDTYLSQLTDDEGIVGECEFCDEEEIETIDLEILSDHVEQAFESHYNQTDTDPDGFEWAMTSDREIGYDWERSGQEVKWAISDAAGLSEEAAEEVRSILAERHHSQDRAEVGEECPFSEGSHYEERWAGNGEYDHLWKEFERGLKTETRFFSKKAESMLYQIFDGITELRTTERSRVVVLAGPSRPIEKLLRARVFAGENQKLKEALKVPWKGLGTPPTEAASAGRMNAPGISVFYGALDVSTAVCEVRPPVGSKVATAEFQLTRDLRLLDLSAMMKVSGGGSVFNPDTIDRMERANFLETLAHLMSRPVMPNEETSEYLPTQAVADYLANEIGLDGIVFPSVQAGQGARNVVLFQHAARVEAMDLPDGSKVEVAPDMHDSDGVHPDYWVSEEIPAPIAESSNFSVNPLRMGTRESFDSREPSMRINSDSIRVHHIDAVSFRFESHSVRRNQFEAPPGQVNLSSGDSQNSDDDDDDDDLFT